MYNGLTGITPWFYDRRTEWWDAPTFNSEAGYRDAYWNELTNNRWGYDLTNISKVSGGLGDFTFTYGLAFANDDIKPDRLSRPQPRRCPHCGEGITDQYLTLLPK